jgi:thiol-disulfide isomerase/thioredoxin
MKNLINKFLLIIFLLISIFLFKDNKEIYAQENKPLDIYFFYGNGCPHCVKEEDNFNDLKNKYNNQILIHKYEIYYDQKNSQLFEKTINQFDINTAGVPFTVIGDKYFIGYEDKDTTGQEINKQINYCLENYCPNLINNPKENVTKESFSKSNSSLSLNTHLFGKIDLKSISIPLATILIAFIDGFNPCAMWILIFLITMLINMKDKKKLYILGTIFIITSGLVYFLFLSAWLNLFKFIGYVYWVKVIIGIVAIISGFLHIKDFFFSKNACRATNQKQKENIMIRIKKALTEKSFILSILGIITLAISVNLIEVVCSAGLPAVYTNLLSTIKLNPSEYYLYLLLYVLIFILDDLFIFFIAIKTFEVTGITKKYTKWSSLIGGVIILIIGIILIIKPELLMFG